MKLILFSLWAMFLFSANAQAVNPAVFQTVVSLKVLCTSGGPEILMEELLEGYNEKPVHAMDISTTSGLNIQMYITENKNNPSSTVLLFLPDRKSTRLNSIHSDRSRMPSSA